MSNIGEHRLSGNGSGRIGQGTRAVWAGEDQYLLGAVETIVAPPATSSHVECTAEERARLGIPEGLIRYSTGIEDVEDLIEDLASALNGR